MQESRAPSAGMLAASILCCAAGAAVAAPTGREFFPALVGTPRSVSGSRGTGTPDWANSQAKPLLLNAFGKGPIVGANVGTFLPTGGRTRDRFGDSWFGVGFGFGTIRAPSIDGRLSYDFNLLSRTRGDNYVYVAPIGVEYRRAFTRSSPFPYAGGSVDAVMTLLRSVPDRVPARIRPTAGGSLFAGTTFSRWGFIEARYRIVAPVAGFNLSGWHLSAGVRF